MTDSFTFAFEMRGKSPGMVDVALRSCLPTGRVRSGTTFPFLVSLHVRTLSRVISIVKKRELSD